MLTFHKKTFPVVKEFEFRAHPCCNVFHSASFIIQSHTSSLFCNIDYNLKKYTAGVFMCSVVNISIYN